ncbi:LemA family protein [Planctomycetes bacterium Pan216]|uniref:LemA family protein n=1 Tax=Kolteria novifilia TaxID=2527975 RepID=A0A518B805_9BACT|nr:LemA family protein [Planctomycetes bacterium Pan216]
MWRFLRLVGFVLCLVLGLVISAAGFGNIQKIREWERLPRTVVMAVMPGEVDLGGKLVLNGEPLSSPRSSTACLYYHYTVERRTEDSDGDESWETIESRKRAVGSFFLVDATGRILVKPSSGVDWDTNKTKVERVGDLRYTEAMLLPDSEAYVVGYAFRPNGQPQCQVGFLQKGQYTPKIGVGTEETARRWLATESFYESWIGLCFLSFAVYFFLTFLNCHQIFLYLTLTAVTVSSVLVYQGTTMMVADLRGARKRVERMLETAHEEFKLSLTQAQLPWNGSWDKVVDLDEPRFQSLPARLRQRLNRIRIDVNRAIDRSHAMSQRFPDWMLASYNGIHFPPPLVVSARSQEELRKLESTFHTVRFGITVVVVVLIVVGFVGSVVLTYLGFRLLKTKRLIENVPTSKSAGVTFGLAEVTGVADLDLPVPLVHGPLSELPCYWYHYTVKEKVKSGKNSSWKTIEDRKDWATLYCRDQDGVFPIEPEGAEVFHRTTLTRRQGKLHYTEHRIEPGEPVYALGSAEVDPETGDRLHMVRGPSDLPFILSTLSEHEVMIRKSRWGLMYMTFGLDLVLFAAMQFFCSVGVFGPIDYLWSALAAMMYLFLLLAVFLFNDLVFLRQRVDRAWSNIDVALKKRFDLVPNLERVAKEYSQYERGLQELVAKLRTEKGAGAEVGHDFHEQVAEAGNAVADRLIALREAYPDLKANTLMRKLMASLVTMENEIALMRDGHNDAVERYNSRIAQIPEVVIARMAGYKRASFFRADVEVREVVDVSLAPDSEERPDD